MTIFDYLCPGLVDTSYPRKGNLFLDKDRGERRCLR